MQNIEVGAVKIGKVTVITQPLALHYVFISCNMKPHSLEFMYLEREDSYARQVCRGCKIYIRSFEAWKEEAELGLLYWNFSFNSRTRAWLHRG